MAGDISPNFPSLASTGHLSLGEESLLSTGEHDPEFVNQTDAERFMCPVHHGLLHEPRQTTCGHRLCLSCIPTLLAGELSCRCPVGEPDCEDVTVTNVLPDNSCLRDMKKALVHCTNKKNGCTHTFMLRELSTHKKICEFEFIPCLYASRGCAVKEFRGKLLKHQEECPFRPVNCKACHLEISHNQLQKHELEECPEQVTGCPYGCGDRKLKRKEQADHRNVCPVHPVDCTFSMLGCTFVGKRESVSAHEKEKLSFHMELVAQKCAELDIKNLDIHRNVQAIARERDELQQSMQSAQGQDQGIQRTLHQIETQTKDLRLKLVSLVERIIVLERKIPEFAEKRRVDELDRSLSAVQGRLTQLEQRQQMTGSGGNVGGQVMVAQYGTVNDMAAAFSTQLTAHDRQLGVHDVRMAEMDLRFQLLETASYDGTLVWKIRDYERRKRDAVSGRTLSLYSQPFYSSRFGYKMCARVYLNGDGMGKTTHMSLFFCHHERRVRCSLDLAISPESDNDLVGPVTRKATSDRPLPARSILIQLPETYIRNECSQWLSIVCITFCDGEPCQWLFKRRHHLYTHCCRHGPKSSCFLELIGLGEQSTLENRNCSLCINDITFIWPVKIFIFLDKNFNRPDEGDFSDRSVKDDMLAVLFTIMKEQCLVDNFCLSKKIEITKRNRVAQYAALLGDALKIVSTRTQYHHSAKLILSSGVREVRKKSNILVVSDEVAACTDTSFSLKGYLVETIMPEENVMAENFMDIRIIEKTKIKCKLQEVNQERNSKQLKYLGKLEITASEKTDKVNFVEKFTRRMFSEFFLDAEEGIIMVNIELMINPLNIKKVFNLFLPGIKGHLFLVNAMYTYGGIISFIFIDSLTFLHDLILVISLEGHTKSGLFLCKGCLTTNKFRHCIFLATSFELIMMLFMQDTMSNVSACKMCWTIYIICRADSFKLQQYDCNECCFCPYKRTSLLFACLNIYFSAPYLVRFSYIHLYMLSYSNKLSQVSSLNC